MKNLSPTLLVSAVLLLGVSLAACDRARDASSPAAAATPFVGADITGATYARTLAMPDINGQARTLGDFKGKVTVV